MSRNFKVLHKKNNYKMTLTGCYCEAKQTEEKMRKKMLT